MNFKIGNFELGKGKTYIIAELSANHNQNYDTAIKLIDEAYKAGADAIKLQTYRADTITINCDKEDFQIKGGTLWDGQTLYKLYEKAYTPWEWHENLKKYANKLGLELFSSPFDTTAVDYLEKLDMPAYKIASCEITDHILIKKIAQTHKPVIISSGNASIQDLQEAVNILRKNGCTQICMLKCTAAYPAKKEDANLLTIRDMMEKFNVIGGLSDHTLGIEVPTISVAMGASVIEKHFTLSRDSGSPDDAFSLTPDEFKKMVESVRLTEIIMGKITYGGVKSEKVTKKHQRSLYVVKDMKKGDKFTQKNLKSIRPGNGLHTKYYWDILGKACNQDIEFGSPMIKSYVSQLNIKEKKKVKYRVIQNKLGYYEIENKPAEEELNNYYAKKYYTDANQIRYKTKYSEEEYTYFLNQSKKIYNVIKNKIKNKNLIDIGCGEGFTLKYFKDLGFNVTGLDYSSIGIKNHNPGLLDNLIVGDIYKNINNLINKKEKYDVVIVKNVLEHVLEPKKILEKLKNILTDDGILCIDVPNDFSSLQNHLFNKEYIDKKFWIAPPDHLSYFNFDSLKNICNYMNYKVIDYYANYPIDFDLFCEHTNYIKNKVGKFSHIKRIRTDNFLCNISIDKVNEYYKILADMGCGRQIMVFLNK